MPIRYVNIPSSNYKHTGLGIIRWISKTTKIPNLNGSNFIRVTADSTRGDTCLTAPIGYTGDCTSSHWVCGGDGAKIEEHWYQIDFLSFEVDISDILYSAVPKHFFSSFFIKTSYDCVQWNEFEITIPKEPETGEQIFPVKAPKARCVRLFTNSTRFDGVSTFASYKFDLFGKIRWFLCSTGKFIPFSCHYSFFLISFLF